MLNRRRTLQTGVATLLSTAAPLAAFPQSKPRVKVRYNEVVRSMLYAPAYVAIAKGYFDELGLDVTLATAQGGDKSVAVMLSKQADIALIGPESAIYVQNSDSPVKIPIFCGLTSTDGFMLVGREKVDKIRLEDAQGQRDPGLPPRQHAAALSRGGAAPERPRPANRRQAHEQCRYPRARGLLAGRAKPIRHLHRAGCLAARARRQGIFHGLDRRDRGACRLHHVHGDRQIHAREQGDAADLDQCHRQGHDMDGASAERRPRKRH